MSTKSLQQLVEALDPEEALAQISQAVKKLWTVVEEEARLHFVNSLMGDLPEDRVGSLVHL